ncbi:hypothetical protein GCM10009827_119990 [Dactylosporangium maewongense]|uniref:Uncharacterized protein n=1 Tax=Dactylosporangium maewongense TaxID=634393 RepID=A0ABP4PCT5_9ACTN
MVVSPEAKQGASNDEHLLFSTGEVPGRGVDALYQLGKDVEYFAVLASRRDHGKVLGHGELREHGTALFDMTYAESRAPCARPGADLAAVEADVASSRPGQPGDGIQQGGLAGSVRA